MNVGSYGPTEPHVWLVSKIPTRTWDNCPSTSERKSRTHTYDDLVDFLGSAASGEREVAGADERLFGLGVPPLAPPLPPPLPPLSPFWGVLVGVWAFWRSGSCRVCLSLSRFFDMTFVLVVTTGATIPTGDATPEMILMYHCFPSFGVLLSFQLQHTTTAMVAVRGMTGLSLVIDRFTVEEWGCTGFRLNLTHGT